MCLVTLSLIAVGYLFNRHSEEVPWVTLAAIFLLALALSYFLSRRLTRSLRRIVEFADALGQGRFGERVTIGPRDELADLARVLNQMAAELQTKIAEISDDRSRLQAILSSMIEGVMVLDRGGKILMFNEALERMLPAAEGPITGRPLLEVWRHHQLNQLVGSVLDSGVGHAGEIGIFMPEERIFSVQASVSREGRIAVVLVFHDVTDLKRLERIRKDFVANISHEIKTPLTSIKGYIEALIDGAEDDPQKRSEFLYIIQRHTDHLNATLSDLLRLSTIESGQYRWRREPISIPDLIGKAVQMIQPAAEKKRQSVTVSLGEPLCPFRGDTDQLAQALINLLDNAVKYTPEGGRVAVKVEMREEELEIQVSDTGVGIPLKEIPRIFERFYRVDRARSRELGGTGLGLSIVKHIVEAHGGTVSVKSKVGKGSRFILTFPK